MWPSSAAAPIVGMGCMRLSTEPDRDETRAVAVLHAALDAGVTLLDTADAYCWNDSETGHNERLIARALATWSGDRTRVLVAAKGGLTRPQGRWVPDGRAKHLASACEASLRALGLQRIPLYQLHAPDPRTPLTTSVRALAALQRGGLVERIGLCNVTVGQIEEARRSAEIDTVQVELSIWNDDNLLSGVAAYCIAHNIRLIAHRPLGGPQRVRRTASDPLLVDLAARHDASPFDIALAWLVDLSGAILPIPGPSRIETAASLGRASSVRLTADDRARLDERFPSGRLLRSGGAANTVPRPVRRDGEIVLIMGLPAAGKSTLARTFVAQGYHRVNRDEAGGSLRSLLPALEQAAASGQPRIVVDNTYVSRKSRAAVVQAAAKIGLPVRCVWLATSVEDAQVNAVWRMLSKYGRLPGPEEMREAVKRDVSAFGPGVQFRSQRELEPPDPAEGFSSIETVPFERVRDPSFTNRALIVWSPTVEHGEVLRRYAADGWRLLGLGWQPDIADKAVSSDEVDAGYARLRETLGVAIDILYCPHGGGPPVCWCRKPLPGLGVVFIQRYQLNPSQCIYVGNGSQDPGFARKLGFQYRNAAGFFGA